MFLDLRFIVYLTYGCQYWTTNKQTERNLRTFENRVWRKMCGPLSSVKQRETGEGDVTARTVRFVGTSSKLVLARGYNG